MALLGAVGTGRRASAAAAAVVMALYCLACDGGASVARAGIVGGLGLAAISALRALGLAKARA